MRIIINTIEYQGDNIIVSCDLGIGILKGIWKGRNLPVLNFNYYVEFTLNDIDSEHLKVLTKNQEHIFVSFKNDKVFFTGICENYDGEVHYIRLEDDWLQMIYIEGNNQSVNVGDNLLFWMDYRQVMIYPYDVL